MAALRKDAGSFFARNRWWIIAAGIVVGVILLAAFNSIRGDVVPIRTVRIVRGNIRSLVSTNGKIEPIQNFAPTAPMATTVKRILVKEGTKVKRGQLLIELDDGQARTSAARALAEVRGAQAEISAVERGGTQEEVLATDAQLVKARSDRDVAKKNVIALEQLVKDGAASIGELRSAQAQYQTAQANVELYEGKQRARYSKPEVAKVEAQQNQAQAAYRAAQDILKKSNVRAPFEGIVYSIPVKQGNYMNPGQLLLEEADLSRVRLRAYVDEPDVGRLAPGQQIDVTWDGLPGRIWQGKLASVPSSIQLFGTRNVGEITTQLDNSDYRLLPSTNVAVQVITAEHKNVLIAPREVVRIDDTEPYVLRVGGDELHRQNISTSISNLTQVEITQGAIENEVLALSAINNKPLRDGQAVKVAQ